jgi:small subunit ribosomal protein S4
LALSKKSTRVLHYLFESYQNNYKYRKLLRKRHFFLNKKQTPFLYKIVSDEKEFKRRKRTMKIANYLMLLKLRRFYGCLGKRKFKRLFKQSSVYTNVLGKSFAYFLESRLDVILYRSNFFPSIFAARQYINHKKVYVNGVISSKPGMRIFLNDIITLVDFQKLYSLVKKRLKNNEILVNYPAYLEVNYCLGVVVLTKMPVNSEVPFPFFMNLDTVIHSFLK